MSPRNSLPIRNVRRAVITATAAVITASVAAKASAAAQVGDVFMIDMENNNWTVNGVTGGGGADGSNNAIKGDLAAPYINSLISTNSMLNPVYGQVAYANNYHNAGDTNTTTGAQDPNIHPSEPNYLWQEGGSNLSINNDNDPYGSGGSIATINNYLATNPKTRDGTAPLTDQHLTGLMQAAGESWKTYQEGTNLLNSAGQPFDQFGGTLTNNVANYATQQTVPVSSFSGTSASYTNPYNGSHQYNFACKHDGTLFYTDTNGGNNNTPTNTEASHYEALESLQSDLNNNTVGQYNLITPDQFNDMHTALSGGFTYNGTHYTGDQAQIAQGDNFLSKIIPEIMASPAYQNNGAIVIWTDETEGTHNDSTDTLMEIVISKLANQDPSGVYSDMLNFDHSSDVATMQEIFQVPANSPTAYLNNADIGLPGGAQDLSDLFQSGVIPATVPEPASVGLLAIGSLSILGRRRRAR